MDSSTISSGAGAITLRGHGQNSAGFSFQHGILLQSGAKLTSTSGGITLNGTGGSGTSYDYGIYLNGNGVAGGTAITTTDGAISLTGIGNGSDYYNHGIAMDNAAQIRSTGTGTVSLTGTGGAGYGNNHGIDLNGNTLITAVNGNISLTGTGAGTSDHNIGIEIANSSQVASTGTGAGAATIALTGVGGNGTQYNFGIEHSGSITSNSGNITLTGTGGTGTSGGNGGIDNIGAISTGSGAILLTGTGRSAGGLSFGIGGYGNILSTGSGTVGGITLSGTGSTDGGTGNDAVAYSGTIRSNDADILLTGTGGLNGSGIGLVGGLVESTAGGNITLAGTAGAGSTFKGGVQLNNATVHVTDGDLLVTGTGNAVAWGWGVFLYNGGTLSSTGTGAGAGKITVNGTGANSGGSDDGILMQDNGTKITSKDGDITLNGTAGTGGGGNHGLYIANDSDITSTGAANIVLTGIAGASGGTDVVTSGATIDLGGAGMTGNITINADSVSLANSNISNQAAIFLSPRTDSTPIGIAGGAGSLLYDAATLGQIHTGNLYVGRLGGTGSGDIHINGHAWDSNIQFMTHTGRIYVDGPQTTSGPYFSIRTDTDPVISADITAGGFVAQAANNGYSIGLGGALGNLQLSSPELDHIHAPTISFGDLYQNTLITAGAYNNWNGHISFNSASAVSITGNQTAAAGSNTTFTVNAPLSLGGNIDLSNAVGNSDINLTGALTIASNSAIKTAALGNITFGSTVDGAHDLDVQTIGNITFGGIVGGGTRLGALTVDPASFTAGATHVGSFALTAGTGPVNFTGTGLDSNGAVSVTTNGNILGRYAGTSGSLHAGTGQVNATVTFGTLDIAGAGATLLAGNIGPLAAPASQAMANMISIGGVAAPTLVANPLYTFATYIIGATTASAGGGPSAPSLPVAPMVPAIPVTAGNTPSGASQGGGNGISPPSTPSIAGGLSTTGTRDMKSVTLERAIVEQTFAFTGAAQPAPMITEETDPFAAPKQNGPSHYSVARFPAKQRLEPLPLVTMAPKQLEILSRH